MSKAKRFTLGAVCVCIINTAQCSVWQCESLPLTIVKESIGFNTMNYKDTQQYRIFSRKVQLKKEQNESIFNGEKSHRQQMYMKCTDKI